MGDGADQAVEDMQDYEEAKWDYFHGEMDSQEAFDRGIINGLGHVVRPIRYKTCRCCGETGLNWDSHDGQWRLFKGKRLHACPVNPLRSTTMGDKTVTFTEQELDILRNTVLARRDEAEKKVYDFKNVNRPTAQVLGRHFIEVLEGIYAKIKE